MSITRLAGLIVGVPSGEQQELHDAAQRVGIRWTDIIVEPDRLAFEHVSAIIADGSLQVMPPRVAPLEDAVEIHRQMAAGRMLQTVLRIED